MDIAEPEIFFMQTNPILVRSTRGAWVENRYRGSFVVADAEGRVILSAGDTVRPIFPRSAVKAMQALAMVTTGAVEAYGLTDEQLALACASHHGEDVHVAGVTHFLDHLGLGEADLECGVQQPSNARAREALRMAGREPSQLHNNCSGKHAGMLAVARVLGVDTRGYVEPDHPVQRKVREAMEAVIAERLSVERCGIDGCSIPTWAAPLTAFARGFARMATGKGLPPSLARGARRIFDAAVSHPLLVAGTDHLDTVTMAAFGGGLMQKGGAEGVQCGAIRDKGWGYALKIDDGNMAASQVLVAGLLLRCADPTDEQRRVLETFVTRPVRNVRGLHVGALQVLEGVFDSASPNNHTVV